MRVGGTLLAISPRAPKGPGKGIRSLNNGKFRLMAGRPLCDVFEQVYGYVPRELVKGQTLAEATRLALYIHQNGRQRCFAQMSRRVSIDSPVPP